MVKTIFSFIVGALVTGSRYLPKPTGLLTLATVGVGNQPIDAVTVTANATVASGGTVVSAADGGLLTVTGLNNAAGATSTATITNSRVAAGDRIQAQIESYTGTIGADGLPELILATTGAGNIVFTIINMDGLNALNGNVVISYQVGKAIPSQNT